MAKWKQHQQSTIQLDYLADQVFKCEVCGELFQIKDYKETYEALKEQYAKGGRKPCIYCFGELCPTCWYRGIRCSRCLDQAVLSKDCMKILADQEES